MPSQTQRAATHRYVSVHKMSANIQHVRRATRCDALAALLEKRESAKAANVTALVRCNFAQVWPTEQVKVRRGGGGGGGGGGGLRYEKGVRLSKRALARCLPAACRQGSGRGLGRLLRTLAPSPPPAYSPLARCCVLQLVSRALCNVMKSCYRTRLQ